MLSLMRFAGYLAPDPDDGDRRRRPLVATPKLLDLLRRRWRSHFISGSPVFPDGQRLAERLDEPAFVRTFVAAMFRRYKDGFRLMMYTPGLGLFGDRSAGMMIASCLMAAGAEDDTVPPSRPFPISISELARRFGVSRVHVSKMLRDAATDGLIARAGANGEEITLTPALAGALSVFYANALLYFFDSAREAAATLDAADRGGGERSQRSA
jgi:DNA-binding MarR family transcriptional regulator